MSKKNIDISNIRYLDLGNFGVKIAWVIEKLFGWKAVGTRPVERKAIFVGAPHTSNWDLPAMFMTALALKLPVYFMMKDNVFWWPLSIIWKRVGGIPVNRREPGDLVKTMVEAFEQRDDMYLVIAPEGTRKDTTHWKLGFYRIAEAAQVPVVYAYCDRKTKCVGVGQGHMPTGDVEADFEGVKSFYREHMEDYVPELLHKDIKRHQEERAKSDGDSGAEAFSHGS